MKLNKHYVIRNTDNDQLFWCMRNGWVESPHETFFNEQERLEYCPPHDGVWCLVSTTYDMENK